MDFNSQKIIALTIAVLVLAVTANYFALAWNAPPSFSLPIDVSTNDQEKAGVLTVASLTLSEISATNNQVFLNTNGNEGDIYNIDFIKGYDDLHLWSEPTEKATVYLDAEEGIKFYTGGAERMVIGSNNNVYVSDDSLKNCFLRVNGSGKVECYTGSNPPDGKFRSTQAEIMNVTRSSSGTSEDFQFVINEEAVIKIAVDATSVQKYTDASWCDIINPYIKSYLYIKEAGSGVWDLKESLEFTANCWFYNAPFGFIDDQCRCADGSKSEIWYYHLKQGDEIKIATQVYEGNYANLISEVIGYNLTFNRQIASYVFTDPGYNVLHYFDKNTTGGMISTPDAYWTPTPVSMAVTADNAPISTFIPPE